MPDGNVYDVHMATDTPIPGQLTIPFPETPELEVGDPDPVPDWGARVNDLCWTDFPGRLPCTRLSGHAGLHAFAPGTRIAAVWS